MGMTPIIERINLPDRLAPIKEEEEEKGGQRSD